MDQFHFVPRAYWMRVPAEERSIIAKAFDLKRTGVTEVLDSEVISDGYSDEDLKGITAEKMAEYVGSDADFPRLWEITVAKARSVANPPLEITVPESDPLPASPTTHAKPKTAAPKQK